MTIPSDYYGYLPEYQWLMIYDFHIGEMRTWMGSDRFIRSYVLMVSSDALREMERQAILSELRRANCSEHTSTAHAATR